MFRRALYLGAARWLATFSVALLALAVPSSRLQSQESLASNSEKHESLWDKRNLVAWCIVPFDSQRRTPQQRAEMLARIGIKQLAYDYRAEHIPTFDDELRELKQHGIQLTAWWFPGELNEEAKLILGVLKKHGVKTQLWVTGGGEPTKTPDEQRLRIKAESDRIRPIAEAAAEIGCSVGLYNHGGWFGEPENQLEIIRHLGMSNVGIVYNLHHGHDHVERLPDLLASIKDHLLALNINGMAVAGDKIGKKILPLGAGELDLRIIKIIEECGYQGPIGILNHTDEDAEARLLDNLDGLQWIESKLRGSSDSDPPTYRSWKGSLPESYLSQFDPKVESLLDRSLQAGDAMRGMMVFASAKFACLSCHKVGRIGGDVGPALSDLAATRSRDHIVQSLLWPQRHVEPEFVSIQVLTANGVLQQGYVVEDSTERLVLRDTSSQELIDIPKDEIEISRTVGSVMPDGLLESMRPSQQADLVAFLVDLGRWQSLDPKVLDEVLMHYASSEPAKFEFALGPIRPETYSELHRYVNRNRLFDFYSKQAAYFGAMNVRPPLLAAFPGLDGPQYGHWGNQDEASWGDGRWNQTLLGSVQTGVFRADGVLVPRAVCLKLGEHGELSACFNPETLSYEAVWKNGFVRFSTVRHGFMDGLLMDGELVERSVTPKIDQPIEYKGFYRAGLRVIFIYRIGNTEYLDSPWVENGKFVRELAPREKHSLKHLLAGAKRQWPEQIPASVALGTQAPYAIDRITLPTENPWNSLIFCGDHACLPNGDILVCTMQGDVWRLSGVNAKRIGAEQPVWTRFAAGLHQALGMVVDEDGVFVLGRDQITRLHDVNNDGEADFYEAFCTAYKTSPAGHDFICGLQRDSQGYFYTASGNQGLLKISPNGNSAEVIATGFRNPDGLGVRPDGSVTVPCSEGNWTPASMICEIRPDMKLPHFGYPGPIDDQAPELPLVYLPRGIDNSSGGQVHIDSASWGPLRQGDNMIHLSFGAGTHFLLIRDEVDGRLQGAVVPLDGDFSAGVHRGHFSSVDGQLYVSGMAGWGTYTTDDGCLARVRYNGGRVQQPVSFHVHENGIRVTFSADLPNDLSLDPRSHFVQVWNYRYSKGYGSPEYSTLHSGVRGHDTLPIRSVHRVVDNKSLFFEIPDIQPVNQLHLYMNIGENHAREMFVTIHAMDQPFSEFESYRAEQKVVMPLPIIADMRMLTDSVPNPFATAIQGARKIELETATNLAYAKRELRVRVGEAIELTLSNPDVVPHNWALLKPGAEQAVGMLANRMVADPEAAARQYIPKSDDVLAYTDVVEPQQSSTIYFRAPLEPGSYPFMCTFPGHWMVMRGIMIVE